MFEEEPEGNAVEKGYDRSLRFLSFRPRSENELRRYLRGKGFDESVIAVVLQRLRDAGLADDPAFAGYWVSNRSRFSPRGRRALRQELDAKGIERTIVDDVLETCDDEFDLALAAGRKRLRSLRNLEYESFRTKLSGYLSRRGFGYGVTAAAVTCLWDEAAATEQ